MRLALFAVIVLVWPLPSGALAKDGAAAAAQRDAAPSATTPAGTASISGSVIAADATAQPMRRAVVTLTGGALRARSAITDDAGKFTFGSLPAGTYGVTARKAAYLAAPYGAKRPGRTGTSIVLVAGQNADLTISMFRGGAISGMLRDAAGLPLGGVDVRAIDVRLLNATTDSAPAEIATTDDRGIYRFYGLLPGDYVLAALPSIGGGEIAAPTTEEIDARLAQVKSRATIGGTAPARPAPPRPAPRVGFAPIFFPGTPYATEAGRVHVDAGGEQSGMDFEVRSVPVAAVEGTVSGDIADLSRVQVTLVPIGPRVTTTFSSSSLSGRPMDAQGRFQYANLAPGRYRLVARATRGDAAPPSLPATVTNAGGGGRAGGGPPAGTVAPGSTGVTEYLYGFVDVDVRGDDITGVSLVLTPGAVVTGRLVLNATGANPRPDDLSRVRVAMMSEAGGWQVSANNLSMGTSTISQSITTTRPDGTFEIRGIGPARFNVEVGLPGDLSKIWRARTAIAGGRDLLDDTLEMVPGADIGNVVVTLTDARTELSGTLQTGGGQPATDYYIVAMSTDRAMWRPRSRRVLSARPATDGRFVFADLPPGEYLVIALTDLDPIELGDPAFLEQLAPVGVKVTIAEGERKVQDLRIR